MMVRAWCTRWIFRGKLAVIALCHCGPLEAANAAVEPVKSFGSLILDTIGPRP